jgi:antitoxin ParD1/3/4
MNVYFADESKASVDQQVATREHASTSEYLSDLICQQRGVEQLRALLLEGASSPAVGEMDAAYFNRLRLRARTSARK